MWDTRPRVPWFSLESLCQQAWLVPKRSLGPMYDPKQELGNEK